MFLMIDIDGINDIRMISNPIHALNHELEDTDTNKPLTRVASRILVELLGIRRERLALFMGYEPISLYLVNFSTLILRFTSWCVVHFSF